MKLKMKPALMIMIIDLVILLAVTTVFGSLSSISNVVDATLKPTLTANAEALLRVYNTYDGDYYLDDSGKAYKGDFCISDHPEIVDGITDSSGVVATFFYDNVRKMTSIRNDSGERIIDTTTTDANVLEYVLNKGEAYFNSSLTISGSEYYVIYYPVKQPSTGKIIGMTFVGMPTSTVLLNKANAVMQVMLIFVIISVLTVVITFRIINGMLKAIRSTVEEANRMATGDLTGETIERVHRRVDETGEMYRSLLRLKASLIDIFSGFRIRSEELVGTSETLDKMADETARTIGHVESAIDEIATGATAQAEDASKAQQDVMHMGQLIEDTAGEINGLLQSSDTMNASGETALGILKELIDVNTEAIKAIELIAEQTNETNEAAMKIREATDIITSIASETNLLSLNASIEAARAGDAGRGFAVVADQISKLADQSNQSGHDIEEITKSLIEDSNKAVQTMSEVREIMSAQTAKMTTTSEAFGVVSKGINESRTSVENINDMAQNLNNARKEMINIIQNLTAVAEENAASTQETSAATSEVSAATASVAEAAISLKKITADLNEDINRFHF